MKKIIVVFMVFLMTTQVFAIELWNGFTSDMGVDQVRARAEEVLEPKGRENYKEYDDFLKFEIFESDKKYLKSQFPKLDSYIGFTSSLTGYNQNVPFSIDSNNVKFHFYRDKLFAVEVWWQTTVTDLLPVVQREYGKHREVLEISVLGTITDICYIWGTAEKNIFLTYKSYNKYGAMYFIDGRSDRFAAEQVREEARKEQERKAAEEARSREAANAVRF